MAIQYREQRHSEELNAYIREIQQREFRLRAIQWEIIITLPDGSVIKSCNCDIKKK